MEKSNRLISHNPSVLRLKRMAVSALPITAKIVDAVFGKLPSVLAKYSASLLSSISSNRRIVIYQLEPVYHNLMSQRFDRLANQSADSDTS